MNKNIYNRNDFPDSSEKSAMWQQINRNLPSQLSLPVRFHWKSFWLGNAAAVLLIFAAIGLYTTALNLGQSQTTVQEQMYHNLNVAIHQLDAATPALLQQAGEQSRNSMESTLTAIREIDRLIEELKIEMDINGVSPSTRQNLKRLYATKLEFYQKLLLTQTEHS